MVMVKRSHFSAQKVDGPEIDKFWDNPDLVEVELLNPFNLARRNFNDKNWTVNNQFRCLSWNSIVHENGRSEGWKLDDIKNINRTVKMIVKDF